MKWEKSERKSPKSFKQRLTERQTLLLTRILAVGLLVSTFAGVEGGIYLWSLPAHSPRLVGGAFGLSCIALAALVFLVAYEWVTKGEDVEEEDLDMHIALDREDDREDDEEE